MEVAQRVGTTGPSFGRGCDSRGLGANIVCLPESAQAVLWKSLGAWRTILDQARDPIFLATHEGRLVHVNKAACLMLGHEEQHLLGRAAGDVFSPLGDSPSLKGLNLGQAMTLFSVPPFETSLATASGRSTAVMLSTSPIRNEQGQIIGILGIARDIHEQRICEEGLKRHNELLEEEVAKRTADVRASEERFRAVVENVATGIIGVGTKGRVESINPAACSILGLTESEAKGRHLGGLWKCEQGESCSGCDGGDGGEGAESSCAPTFPLRCRIQDSRGREVSILRNRSVLRNGSGKVLAVIHTLTDLSPQLRAKEELERACAYLSLVVKGRRGRHKIVGKSRAVRDVLDFIAATADSTATVLIEGDSGTGKELVAETLHLNSSRRDRPYVVVNCATLNESLLESQLFGHERGAFTGAVSRKRGLLEAAHTGTLLIDEVADMPLSVQAKLLRALENGSFRRVGGNQNIRVDVRFLAATNRSLAEEVEQGRFRKDLFYRLNVLHVTIPPLRERVEDIPLLVGHFLETSEVVTSLDVLKHFSPRAMDVLPRHSWPGNVRELRNAVERAALVSQERALIDVDALPREILSASGVATPPVLLRPLRSVIDEARRDHIARVVAAVGHDRRRAAGILGLSVRQLRRLLNGHGNRSA